jgi:diaminopimelate decarboxylase
MMELKQGRFEIQGVDLETLCQKYDSPLYVYDAQVMKRQVEILQRGLSGVNCKIKYAMKALSNISILKYLKSLGVGLDCVSIQEVKTGIKVGYDPSEILYTPNSVSFSEIKEAVAEGVVINVDNISILEQFGHEYGDQVECCIRLNPHIMAGGSVKISTGHIDSKFGISIYQMRHLLRIIDNYKIKVVGIHVHTGSDILDIGAFLQGAEIIFDAAHSFKELKFLDFGSGFKVPYKEGDIATDVSELGDQLAIRYKDFCNEYGRNLEIWFEPGKFIVSEAGILIVRVNSLKTTPASVFAAVDSGLNHLIRPMMYDAYHEVVNLTNNEGHKRICSIVGYICETDTIGSDRKLHDVREGDLLAIKNAGAYGISMASNYNSRLRPAEVIIANGKDHLIRRREELEDLFIPQIAVEI